MTNKFHEYMMMLMRLHLLIKEGKGNSDEANEVREQMEIPEKSLTPEQQEEANNWSGFLYEFNSWVKFGKPYITEHTVTNVRPNRINPYDAV